MDILGIILIGISAVLYHYSKIWLRLEMAEKDRLPLYKLLIDPFRYFKLSSENLENYKIPIIIRTISIILLFFGLLMIIFNHI